MITIAIADDHHLVRQGIRALLERQPDLCVVGEAQDGQQAIEIAKSLHPDLLLLDINMPLLNGIEVTRRIGELSVNTQVLILSMYSDESLVKKAFRNGARGYLLKKSISDDLIEAVRAVGRRNIYISPELQKLFPEGIEGMETNNDPTDPYDRLTNREREVCQLIAQGNTNTSIANQLGISVKTVEKHRANLMQKLGVKDTASLIREAIRHGIVFVDKLTL